MKKIVVLLFIMFMPIMVFARTDNKTVVEIIEDSKNVIVDEDIVINSIVVDNDKIQMKLLEKGKENNRLIDYHEDNGVVSFSSGTITMPIAEDKRANTSITSNEYAFYIYSILENKANTPYEEANYYNNQNIQNKTLLISKEDIDNVINGKVASLDYFDSSHTFGLSLELLDKDNSNVVFKIVYHCFLDSNYNINKRVVDNDELLVNPSTGNYNTQITFMLLIVLGIGAYTLYNPKKGENNNE